jgi:hypothetical protein
MTNRSRCWFCAHQRRRAVARGAHEPPALRALELQQHCRNVRARLEHLARPAVRSLRAIEDRFEARADPATARADPD